MLPNLEAACALAQRQRMIDAYGAITSIDTLEALRDLITEEDRKVLDLVIVLRKRAEMARLERLSVAADLLEKASLPVAAAMPLFFGLLAGEHFVADAWRPIVTISSYVLGASLWVMLRATSFVWARSVRAGLARLGRVD